MINWSLKRRTRHVVHVHRLADQVMFVCQRVRIIPERDSRSAFLDSLLWLLLPLLLYMARSGPLPVRSTEAGGIGESGSIARLGISL